MGRASKLDNIKGWNSSKTKVACADGDTQIQSLVRMRMWAHAVIHYHFPMQVVGVAEYTEYS